MKIAVAGMFLYSRRFFIKRICQVFKCECSFFVFLQHKTNTPFQ